MLRVVNFILKKIQKGLNVMSIFAMSDTHFSQSVEKPMDIFGTRWYGWTEKIINEWKSTVKDSDTVIVYGDISWAMTMEEARADLELLNSLPGTKLIGKGNHDYWWGTVSKVEDLLDENYFNTIKIFHNNSFEVDGKILVGCRGWYNDAKTAPKNTDYKKIVAREVGRLKLSLKASEKFGDGERLSFFHFPPVFADYICREIVDVLHENGIKRAYYGHIHGEYQIPQTYEFEGIEFTCVSSDFLNFRPYLI